MPGDWRRTVNIMSEASAKPQCSTTTASSPKGNHFMKTAQRIAKTVANQRLRVSRFSRCSSKAQQPETPRQSAGVVVHSESSAEPDPIHRGSKRSEVRPKKGVVLDCDSSFHVQVIDLDSASIRLDTLVSPSIKDDGNLPKETTIALYKDFRCVYPNGSPAFVTPGDTIANIPQNYLDYYKGNHGKARKAWKSTQAWRKENRVWDIHRRPHPLFRRIKEAYPHIIHGYSKAGQVVVYEHPGKMNLKQLFRSGCHVSDMLEHLTFFLEYVGNCLGTRDELRALNGSGSGAYSFASWGTMVVMDIQGCSISSLTGDVMSYLSQSSTLQSEHYPNVLKRVFVVNSPTIVAGAWSMVKGIVPQHVRVEILSSSLALEAMLKYIDKDQIPPEYGGSSPFALGEHPYELGCYDVARKAGEFLKTAVNVEPPTMVDEPRINSTCSF